MALTKSTDCKSKDLEKIEPKKNSIFGVRHLQCFLIFVGLSVSYAMRVNLSVAIVAMTDKEAANPDYPEYKWNEKTKSLLLSSFFWGYVITQVPAGYMARKFGGKIMIGGGVLICSILTVLTPLCASIGNWPLVCALRVLEGLSQGALFPSSHTIIAKWAPVSERGVLGTCSYSGSQFGTVVMLAVSGVLASSSMGWPSIFYISGGVGIIWVGVWMAWGASSPGTCKYISVEEKLLIDGSLGSDIDEEEHKSTMTPPWGKFFTSVPFLVLVVAHSAHNWGFWTLLTEMPSYMKHILGFDIKSNALLSALPYLAMFLLCFVFSAISSVLNRHNCMSLSFSRKFFNTLGQWIPMISLICLGYVTADQRDLAIALLTTTVGINAATYLGFQVNHIDLSPNFAGILMGITNCAANVMSIIAPLLVGLIVTDETDPDQWRIVFFISGGIYFFGNLLFIVFGKTEVQPWNEPSTINNTKDNDKSNVESKQ